MLGLSKSIGLCDENKRLLIRRTGTQNAYASMHSALSEMRLFPLPLALEFSTFKFFASYEHKSFSWYSKFQVFSISLERHNGRFKADAYFKKAYSSKTTKNKTNQTNTIQT